VLSEYWTGEVCLSEKGNIPAVCVTSSGDNVLKASRCIQAEASAAGFDWPHVNGVLDKVREEVQEIQTALDDGDLEHARRELGDLLLVTVNLSRFLEADPAHELSEATSRFSARFALVKEEVIHRGWDIKSCTLEQLDSLWDHAKKHTA
jgi:uncharacterized protein YabN with tetrapyrrole methylase and pyrophosphatase domain